MLAELEELEQEELDKQLLEVNPVGDQLPSVPDTEPVAASKFHARKPKSVTEASSEINRLMCK